MNQTLLEKMAEAIKDNIAAGLPDGVGVDYDYAARAALTAAVDHFHNPTVHQALYAALSE